MFNLTRNIITDHKALMWNETLFLQKEIARQDGELHGFDRLVKKVYHVWTCPFPYSG